VTKLSVWAPKATRLDAVLRDDQRLSMQPSADGWFVLDDGAVAPAAEYRFSNGGGPPLPDPRSRSQPHGPHGPSHVVDLSTFPWTDAGWQRGAWPDQIVYELHIGTFTPEGTFASAVTKLDALVDLGVTAVEVMPIAEFPGDRGWGYDGVDLFAPHHAYGGPAGFAHFVDECHERGLAVVLDVVYNHLGPDGNYLAAYGPYFTDRYSTPWGSAVNFDGPDSGEVRAFFVDNARQWLDDYHCDGLRLDAVHAIYDSSPVPIVAEIAAAAGDRWVIVESDARDPHLVTPRREGGLGATAKWSDDFHHALHVALTDEHAGYYAGFGGLDDVARCLENVFARGPASGVEAWRFLGYAQNHDQVGNRAAGDRLHHIVGVARAKVAAAVVLTAPFVPMLFQGEEWAASTPFQYFTDHRNPRLARAVSEGRRREFSAFGWAPDAVPDPQDPATFARSQLQWDERDHEPHRDMLDWYRALIALRRATPELRTAPAQATADVDAGTLVVRRGPFTIIANVGTAEVTVAAGGDVVLAS
jgi:maltooligosyltrehalose trehalohydrolase